MLTGAMLQTRLTSLTSLLPPSRMPSLPSCFSSPSIEQACGYLPGTVLPSSMLRNAALHVCAAAEDTDLAIPPPAPSQPPAPRREGYRSFACEGCEFLVAEDPTGCLNLSETFVVEEITGELRRARINGDVPAEPRLFQATEWAAEWGGNMFEGKEEKRWVIKVYLIAVASVEPYELDMEHVFVLDGAEGSLTRLPVERLAPHDTPKSDLRVRIRENSVVIDVVTGLPEPEEVVQAAMAGTTAMSTLEAAAAAGAAEEAAKAARESEKSGEVDVESEEEELLYDDDNLRDFMVEIDDDVETEFEEEFDMPATDF